MKKLVAKLFLLIITIFALSNGLNLPTYFKKCKQNDPNLNECILKSMQDGFSAFTKGDNKYHIQSTSPLHVPFMHVRVDSNLYGNLTNGIVDGLKDINFQQVKVDLEKKRMEFLYTIPVSSVYGKYDVSGNILGLPIGGQGWTNVTFVDGLYRFKFDYNLREKRGKHYITITDNTLDYDKLSKVIFDLQLQNSNLGKVISNALNDNWQELSTEISKSVGGTLSQVIAMILQPFFNKVPIEELFVQE